MFSTPQEALREGIRQMDRGSLKMAWPLFRTAYQLDQESRSGAKGAGHLAIGTRIDGDPTIVSYFALGYGIEEMEMAEALRMAKWAIQQDKNNWESHFNLAQLLYPQGDRASAVKHLEIADRLSGGHKRVQKYWESIGRRSNPPLPFLSRENPLNKALGKLLSKAKAG